MVPFEWVAAILVTVVLILGGGWASHVTKSLHILQEKITHMQIDMVKVKVKMGINNIQIGD